LLGRHELLPHHCDAQETDFALALMVSLPVFAGVLRLWTARCVMRLRSSGPREHRAEVLPLMAALFPSEMTEADGRGRA
jgi:hypothetical protein